MKRSIIEIDEKLCDGCGQCIPNCAEGAIRIIDGKARLISDTYCDGLGACIGHCPNDAIKIVERDADPFDEEAVENHLRSEQIVGHGRNEDFISKNAMKQESTLSQWPVQLRLVSVKAPFFKNAEILVVADCVPFAYPNLHSSLLKGRSVVVGCPKFDDPKGYAQKLGEILKQNDVLGITVLNMEVPCCHGLRWIVDKALEISKKKISVQQYVVTLKGELKEVKK